MSWLDNWAERRYRRRYASADQYRTDALGLAYHLRNSLPTIIDGQADVYPSTVYLSENAVISDELDAARAQSASAGGAEFWVEDHRNKEDTHVVFVIPVKRVKAR